MPQSSTRDRSLRHHAVIGESPEELTHFYATLGFSTVVDREVPNENYIRLLSGGVWTGATIVKIGNEFGDVLEIISPRLCQGESDVESCKSWSHIALTVEDMGSTLQKLTNLGATIEGGPVTNPDAPYLVAYIRDPSQNLIELVQRLE